MAGDWIKMRSDLLTHPKVVRIMSALKADKLRVIGGLHAVWCLFDMHSTDGALEGYTPEILDAHLGWTGFSAEMARIGWLEIKNECLVTPRFDEHNGQSAKRRAQETERKRLAREAAELSALVADEKRTREEKRREEEKKAGSGEPAPTDPPAEKKTRKPKTQPITLTDYLESRKAQDLPPIDPGSRIFTYADEIHLPQEFLALAWAAFQDAHNLGNSAGKKQADWPATFLNALKGNWYKLWWLNGTTYELTTQGKQAQLAARSA